MYKYYRTWVILLLSIITHIHIIIIILFINKDKYNVIFKVLRLKMTFRNIIRKYIINNKYYHILL